VQGSTVVVDNPLELVQIDQQLKARLRGALGGAAGATAADKAEAQWVWLGGCSAGLASLCPRAPRAASPGGAGG
jgi:hypothetical protein